MMMKICSLAFEAYNFKSILQWPIRGMESFTVSTKIRTEKDLNKMGDSAWIKVFVTYVNG